MSLELQDLRDLLRSHLGNLDEQDMPDSEADSLLNRSWWEVADKFKFKEKEGKDSFPTVESTAEYDLSSTTSDLFGLTRVAAEDTYGKHFLLNRIDESKYESEYDEDSSQEGFPTHYFRRDVTLTLHPTPDAAYTIYIYYQKTLADLSSGGPDVPRSWHEVILLGAVWRGYLAMKDFAAVNAVRNTYTGLLNSIVPVESVEATDTRHIRVEPMIPDYP